MSHVVHNAEDSCLNKNQPEVVSSSNEKNTPDVATIAQDAHSASSSQVPSFDAEATTPATDMRSEEEKHDYPEGGPRAWLVVFGCWCAQFLVFGIVNSTSVFQDYLSANQLRDHTPGEIAWIFSLNLFLVFFLGLYVGPIFDAYGSRLLVLVGTTASVLSAFLLSFCTTYWHFMLVYAVLGGFGNALLSVTSYASVGHFFERRRGLATGVACTAGSFGGIVIPLMLRSLLPSIGFAWSMRILGFILLALAIPANLLIKKRLPPSQRKMSLVPDLSVLLDRKFAFCVAGMFFMEWGLFSPLAYIASYASINDGGESFGFIVLALMNVGSFFGRWMPGYAADRLGRFNVIIVTIAFCAITNLALWLPSGSNKSLLIAFAILFGFVSGSNLGLIPVCLSQLCRMEDYGRAFSAAFFVISFGTLTSIPIAGQILQSAGGEYWGVTIFAGVAYAAALICYVVTRVLAVGWDPSKFF